MHDAPLRACVAQTLSLALGSCQPRRCFLSGLLLELPAMVRLSRTGHSDTSGKLLASMCRSLPAVVVRGALAKHVEEKNPSDPAVAVVLISDALLHLQNRTNQDAWLQDIADQTWWQPWSHLASPQRMAVLSRARTVAVWAEENLYRMDPWNFMANLERQRT